MSRKVAYYFEETGEIDSIDDFGDEVEDSEIDAEVPDGCVWLEGDADPETDYIVLDSPPVITERPSFGADEVYHVDADGATTTLFTMPEGTVVTYRGSEFIAGLVALDVGGGVLLDVGGGFVLGVGTDDNLDFDFASSISGEFPYLVEPPFPYKSISITVIADAV